MGLLQKGQVGCSLPEQMLRCVIPTLRYLALVCDLEAHGHVSLLKSGKLPRLRDVGHDHHNMASRERFGERVPLVQIEKIASFKTPVIFPKLVNLFPTPNRLKGVRPRFQSMQTHHALRIHRSARGDSNPQAREGRLDLSQERLPFRHVPLDGETGVEPVTFWVKARCSTN